ncbi:MAG: PadR family transcriptional regulator [Acidimicrobiales bacterium]
MSVRYALLALLSEGPKYGMQLKEEYEGTTGDAWPLNVGQVYTTLQRLERDGLVESTDAGEDERQRDYRITRRGRTELDNWFATPLGPGSPPRDELTTKMLVALRVPGVDVHELIRANRRQVVELMQQWTSIKPEKAELDLPFALMVERELSRLEATVKWLDVTDRLVSRSTKQRPRASGPRLRRRVVLRS